MKNLHIQHVEDLLFKEASALVPLKILYEVYHFLNDEFNDVNISVKWDGSPAFVCGIEPENKRFFLGTKSVFIGKVNYSYSDIDANYPDPKLRWKLYCLFDKLSKLNWDGVYQGDVLWFGGNVDFTNQVFKFQPNTLTYQIPLNSEFGKMCSFTGLGAVLHTTYTGNALKTMNAHVGAKVPKHSDDIHLFEPSIKQPDSIFSHAESEYFGLLFKNLFGEAKKLQETYGTELDNLSEPKHTEKIQKYINHCISCGSYISNVGFFDCQSTWLSEHCASLKTEKGKTKAISLYERVHIPEYILEYYKTLIYVKNYLITGLDSLDKKTNIFLPNGNQCGHEGYVAEYYPNMCKLVVREIFSKANFNYVKDWQK